MDMYKLKFTRLQNEIFRLLCIKAGSSLNQRDIAKTLKVSPTAVSKALPLLEKEKLIEVKRLNKINLLSIKFNRDSQIAINLKKLENLKLIYESELLDFLNDAFLGCTIILFGSYSKGEDINMLFPEGHKSDIDIAVIGMRDKKIDLTKFEKLLEREININFYESWKIIDQHLKNNILNGVILHGGVEL
ncbi:MAG: nucleotidyltransferase domain-containing protein [Nanoarchaeota archaeon]